ncbi:Clavaminate synthase-like protein [Gloeophyllum trabeum ATCC 11539]|uniref:Clavaminate synthase-like protein n=1 Tax=Gloeophyllum trabeum (strain ATCC 11539 / FP-39264 / Madison 617) TaxID=670483 RepID=S7Q952_GLOTA|nr:Clavaminate synthase-like protein [Gloeophyllum trabeum ATCC 11539]EPQ56027.1 Clavaminate synthase-like protein [Gloeophyllum trabeum ATCC 11539]
MAPELGSYQYVPETKEILDWADLVTLDLSKYGTPEGNKELAKFLIDAIREKGFFYVKNFNISQERVNRQFALGKEFYELPLEEKLKYVPDLDNGKFNGYTPAGRRIIDEATGLRDRIEIYNIPKFNGHFPQKHPAVVQERITEIEEFARALHTEVLDPLFVLLAIALELPEDYFTNIHRYEDKSEDHLRYMKYSKYSPEETARLTSWVQGHTDLGSFTLLFRQPVAALQIKDHSTGEWKWVKPQDRTLTVNACDALSFLTGGYVKSTIHRVTIPPKDQQHVDRLGLLYFSRPRNDLKLYTVKSPLLEREGYTQNEFEASGNPVPTMEEWTFAKQKWQRTPNRSYADNAYRTATILPGFKEKIYDEVPGSSPAVPVSA